MNQALLGKWLRRLGDESDGLWKQILVGKFGVGRNSLDVSNASYNCSFIWKSMHSVKDMFMKHITYKVESGENISFWHDRWVGDRPLATQFLDLYRCV